MGINKEMYECVQELFIQEMKNHQKKAEAIPIEWIKNEIDTYPCDPAMDDWEYYYTVAVKHLLKRWEKENGRKTNDSQDNNTL